MSNSQSKEQTPLDKLKDRHRLAVEEYCTGAEFGRQFHKGNALRAAGYSDASTRLTAEIFNREDVQEAVRFRLNQVSMSSEEIISRFTAVARAEVGDLFEPHPVTGLPYIPPDKLDKARPFISEFGVDSNGFAKYKFHDSQAALDRLAKIRGLNKDNHVISGPNGGAVPVEMVIKFEDPE